MSRASCWLSSSFLGAGSGAGGSAIACIEVAGDVSGVLIALGVGDVPVGSVRLRRLPIGDNAPDGADRLRDEAVVARWASDRATLMPHGGRGVVEGVMAALRGAGVAAVETRALAAKVEYPEAGDAVEAEMLRSLAHAASSTGVELLMDQPRRWRKRRPERTGAATTVRDAVLRRLIEPALIVAVGPPNVGKSSLLNALAGRGVSVVADVAGTTRDHVGALIDLAGVVVRWVDTPGIDSAVGEGAAEAAPAERIIQREAQRIALEVASCADVLVVCGDATGVIEPPPTRGTVLRVWLRSDLGAVSGSVGSGREVDARVSVRNGTGIERLVEVVREAVVPRREIESPEPWVFWGGGRG